jgi:hypothetical protein
LRIEKMAVLAPMPSASDSTAAAVTIGVDRSARSASRRSCTRGFYPRSSRRLSRIAGG